MEMLKIGATTENGCGVELERLVFFISKQLSNQQLFTIYVNLKNAIIIKRTSFSAI